MRWRNLEEECRDKEETAAAPADLLELVELELEWVVHLEEMETMVEDKEEEIGSEYRSEAEAWA